MSGFSKFRKAVANAKSGKTASSGKGKPAPKGRTTRPQGRQAEASARGGQGGMPPWLRNGGE